METKPLEVFTAVQRALPEGQMVIANPGLRTLSLLNRHGSALPLQAQEQFTASEWRVLLVLLRAYPLAAPYETLSAALHDLPPPDGMRYPGNLRENLRPVWDAVHRLRQKLVPFELGIAFQPDTGYVLTIHSDNPSSAS